MAPAIPAPHRGESLPMCFFILIVTKLLKTKALANSSSDLSKSLAVWATGIEQAIPWFPLPAVVIIGIAHPSILASEAAAEAAIILLDASLENKLKLPFSIILLPTWSP